MKTFLTTAAIVAALAMPAYAQQGKPATNAPAGISGAGEANQKGGAMNAPMKRGNTPTDDKGQATNSQAGNTGAGEANQKGGMKGGTTGAGMKTPTDNKMTPAANSKAGNTGAGEANQKK